MRLGCGEQRGVRVENVVDMVVCRVEKVVMEKERYHGCGDDDKERL